MSEQSIRPQVVTRGVEPLWFLGTLQRILLDGKQTAGRFALIDSVAPRGAAPPLHSHLQDETFYVLEGELTALRPQACRTPSASNPTLAAPWSSPPQPGSRRCIELLASPRNGPMAAAPPDGPRVSAGRIADVEREGGHDPPRATAAPRLNTPPPRHAPPARQ